MKMLKPLYDHVVLQLEEAEKKTASGIILAENTKEKPSIAKVIAVGQGKLVDGKLVPLQVKVNDRVVFKKYATTEVKIDNEEYCILSEDDILAIVE